MTTKEKQQAGIEYISDEQMEEQHVQARQNCLDYNNISPLQIEERYNKLTQILGSVGKGVRIYSPFMFDFGTNISIGDNSFVNCNCVMLDCGKITIGKNVFIGPQCGFYTPLHPLDVKKRNEGIQTAKPIVICDNVWLGGGVTILPGVTIGEGAVVGAGSVVTKDIPPYVLAHGNPCKVVRRLDK